MIDHTTYCKLSFDVEGSSKLTQALIIPLIRVVEKAQQFEAAFRVIKYEAEVQVNESGVAISTSQIMKEILNFIKQVQDFFYQIQYKGKSGGRVYTKYLVMHNYLIEDIAEILKEEFSEIKLYVKP